MRPLAPWLEEPYRALVAELASARLPHALLIHGPGGWGEVLLADALALRLIERDAAEVSAATIAHPDVRWIVPEGAGEQIGVDAVRAAAEFAVRTPQIALHKAVVITRADAMNAHSANALLKTLEEPPADSYIILVTDSLRDLLPTLRSRCRLVRVRPPSGDTVQRWIADHAPTVEAERLELLSFEYGGAPYHVLGALERDEQPIQAALCSVAADRTNPLNLAEAWAKSTGPETIDRWMRYVSRAIQIRRTGAISNDPIAAALAQASDRRLFRFWDQLAGDRQLLRGTTNPNTRLLLESRLIAWRDLAMSV